MKHEHALYNEVVNTLQTGDLMLFHGMSFSSKLNEFISGSEWSHVGMIIRPEDIGITSSTRLLLWESNTLVNLPDAELGKPKTGPMLVDLEERMQTDITGKHDDIFRVRYNTCVRTPEMMQQLRQFICEVHGDTFPKTDFDLRKEVFEGIILNKEVNNGDFFCSKLIAATYMSMGILSKKYPDNSYEPKDFSSDGVLPFILRGQLIEGPLLDVTTEAQR